MMLPSFQSSVASSPLLPLPSLPASTTSLPPSLSASTAPHNDPSDPTHNNHQTHDPNPDAPEPASNLNKPTTTTPSATSCEELNVDDQIPRDGMIFDSEEEVRAFYNKYGHEVGFGVRQSSTLTRGKLKYFALGCSKGGKYTPKEGSSKLKLSSKTGCEAKNFVSVRSTGRSRGYENLQFDERDYARSRAAHDSFGDVISFDSTYLTNRYNMPFSPFVGVNHHGQSILFGCGLLSREDIETYVWLFKSWLECMRGRAPRAIITYQCQSIKAAAAQVFPQSHHRFCLWHIMKKVPEKLGALARYKEIKKSLKIIVYDSMESMMMQLAKILIEKDVKEIPSYYILNRWRKNIRHNHYYVQNCYVDWETSEQAIQIDKLCANFFEAAYMVNSKQKYEFLMKCVNEAKEKLRDTLSWDNSSQASCVGHATKPSAKLVPPLQVRSKGRPPSKRKESKVEKIMKTTRKKKKANSSVDNLQEPNGVNCSSTQPTYSFSPLQEYMKEEI
ncbi:hypothetical protein OROGR_032964 [Orobanche gracilis]